MLIRGRVIPTIGEPPTPLSFKGSSQEELPHVQGQGQRPRVPGCDGLGTAEKSYPSPRSGAAARRSYPVSEVRGSGQEELPKSKVRGGSQEELPKTRGQGRQPGGSTTHLKPEARGNRREEVPHASKPKAKGSGGEEQPHD